MEYQKLSKAKARRFYKLLRAELCNRIEEIQKIDSSLVGEPGYLVDLYTVTIHQETNGKRLFCTKNPALADFYFLSRVIGSCTNAQQKRQIFKSYFGDFLTTDDIQNSKCETKFKWIKRSELPNENGYWDNMLKLVIADKLDQDRSGLSKVLCNFNVEKLSKTTPKKLLDNFRKQAKKNIYTYNKACWERADQEPFLPKKYNCELFIDDDVKLFPLLSRCIISACKYVVEQGGSSKWLKKLDGDLNDNTKLKENKENLLAELDKWEGYGPALAQDFFKDMGFDAFGKADTHVIRLLKGLGFIAGTGKGVEEAVDGCLNHLASQIGDGVSAHTLDKMIWLLLSGRFYKHTQQAYRFDGKKGGTDKSVAMFARLKKQLESK